ncbi:hypothetical protein HJFPF1_05809 [Paramyrothecium foliicola]|nr:hypothetical protein HJFPF1_05809 [Paramyrothecium foliicola]
MTKALHTLKHFPEMTMIHPDLFRNQFQGGQNRSRNGQALIAALLALVKQIGKGFECSWTQDSYTSEEYASFACGVFSKAMLEPPTVLIVQAHVILTWYEWGVGDFQKAWIHCGIAVRIMQSLHSRRIAPVSLDEAHDVSITDEISEIVEVATYWACYILDCTISSGAYNPRMLSAAEMRKLQVPRPPSATRFAFGSNQHSSVEPQILGIDRSYEILVDGFGIFADTMAFTYNDGRKAPGMCAPDECPWVAGSQWATYRNRVEEWRGNIDERLHFPTHSLGAHEIAGSGRHFAYINLLYYHAILMLHREYFPFLPRPDSTPRGPTDPPLLESEAPPGWWENSAKELFEATENVTLILQDASDWGLDMLTPVPAFCGFSACYMNNYALHFPHMTCGHGARAKELCGMGMEFLERFEKLWPLGRGWLRTIHNASNLFKRVNEDAQRFRNKSRQDFEILHHSAHEFRTIDRTEQHLATIRSVDNASEEPETQADDGGDFLEQPFDISALNASNYTGDHILWPTWYDNVMEEEPTSIMQL